MPNVRRRAVSSALLFVLALGVACASSPNPVEELARTRAAQARDVARRAGLPLAIGDFLARYAAGSAAGRFTVDYQEFTLTQDPPRRRVDVGGQSFFLLPEGTFQCAAGSCQRATTTAGPIAAFGPLDPAAVSRTVTDLVAARATFTLELGARIVAGVRATCLTAMPRSGSATPSTVCISEQGAVLVRAGGQNPLRAVHYSTWVARSAFVLPAQPPPP